MTFDPSGPYTLEWALECARNGYPVTLLWMIEEQMGAEVAAVLHDLLKHPEKLAKTSRAFFTPNQAHAIRERYKRVRKAHPKAPAPIIQEEMAWAYRISFDLLTNILKQKGAYAPQGVRVSKTRTRYKRKK